MWRQIKAPSQQPQSTAKCVNETIQDLSVPQPTCQLTVNICIHPSNHGGTETSLPYWEPCPKYQPMGLWALMNQESTNYGLWAKSDLFPVNKVLLEYSHTPLFTCCLFLRWNSRFEYFWQRLYGLQSLKLSSIWVFPEVCQALFEAIRFWRGLLYSSR